MAIKITTENNPVTLATAGKFCKENIQVEFTDVGGGGDTQAIIDSFIDGSVTNVETKAKHIKAYFFYDNESLVYIDMPFVTSIGFSTFKNCSKLALTELPASLTSIGSDAFYRCYNLALTELPTGLTSIGYGAFKYCSKLALTELPAGITLIDTETFKNCSKLALTELPAGITSIGSNAFYSCSGLTTITFRGKPTTINAQAFYQCANITTINVPWSEGAVANAPWGATKATINYNYTGE